MATEEAELTEEVLNGNHISFGDDASGGYYYLKKLYGSNTDEMEVFFYYAYNKGEAPFRDDRGHRFKLTHDKGDYYTLTAV